jgi:hypothetical protein
MDLSVQASQNSPQKLEGLRAYQNSTKLTTW